MTQKEALHEQTLEQFSHVPCQTLELSVFRTQFSVNHRESLSFLFAYFSSIAWTRCDNESSLPKKQASNELHCVFLMKTRHFRVVSSAVATAHRLKVPKAHTRTTHHASESTRERWFYLKIAIWRAFFCFFKENTRNWGWDRVCRHLGRSSREIRDGDFSRELLKSIPSQQQRAALFGENRMECAP